MTTAELQARKGLFIRKLTDGFNSRIERFARPTFANSYAHPASPMFMWTQTQNFVAKFTDNVGTLGNSDIFDSGGMVGIGTSSPQSFLEIASNSGTVFGITVATSNSLFFGTQGSSTMGSSLTASAGFSSGYNGVFLNSNGTGRGDVGVQMNTLLPSWRMSLGSGSQEWAGGDNFAIGRVAAGGTYTSPSILFSIANNGKVKVNGGVDNTGTGITHARVSGCTIAANAFFCSNSITWPTAFADANYTVSCMGGFRVGLASKTSTGVTVNYVVEDSVGASRPGGELDCIAMHD